MAEVVITCDGFDQKAGCFLPRERWHVSAWPESAKWKSQVHVSACLCVSSERSERVAKESYWPQTVKGDEEGGLDDPVLQRDSL
jgi:hypothetical protein